MAPGGHSNSETRIRDEHTESPPTAADAGLDDVARMPRLLQDNTHLLQEGDTTSIFQRVKDKRSSGEYHFDRYETMQLFNLCFYQVEIRPLESGIFDLLKSKDKDQTKLLNLANKINLLRQLLKEYSKPKREGMVLHESNKDVHVLLSYLSTSLWPSRWPRKVRRSMTRPSVAVLKS